MKTRCEEYPRDTLEGFAEKLDLVLVLKEYEPESKWRWSSRFDAVERVEGGMLVSEAGFGQTKEEATEAYMKTISTKTIVRNAFTKHRVEIMVPLLTGVSK